MKLIFLTTTAIAFGAFTTSTAQTTAMDTPSSAAFTQMIEAVQTTSAATRLHTGDFQINARAVKTEHLYAGQGSSLMYSIRRVRD